MFLLSRPASTSIEQQIEGARNLPSGSPRLLSLTRGLDSQTPPGFAHDRTRSRLGHGNIDFLAAKRAFERWKMFELGWVQVANPGISIAAGEIVAVEARTLGLWTLNLSRILETVDQPAQFGFLYSTTELHVEQGEERFILELNVPNGEVCYELEAISRPRQTLARLGFPLTRAFQHRFARGSHRRMLELVRGE